MRVFAGQVFGQPQLAYEALVNVVANIRAYDRSNLRVCLRARAGGRAGGQARRGSGA